MKERFIVLKTVHCPQCGKLLFKQIEPVQGRIQVKCADCRTSFFLTFENGKLTTVVFDEKGGCSE